MTATKTHSAQQAPASSASHRLPLLLRLTVFLAFAVTLNDFRHAIVLFFSSTSLPFPPSSHALRPLSSLRNPSAATKLLRFQSSSWSSYERGGGLCEEEEGHPSTFLSSSSSSSTLVVGASAQQFADGHYDESYARYSMYYTKIAQCPDKAIEQWDCRFCPWFPFLKDREIVHSNGVASKVARQRLLIGYDTHLEQIVVAFRSTTSYSSYVENVAGAPMVPYYDPLCVLCFVQWGPQLEFLEIRSQFEDALTRYMHRYRKASILFTGYAGAATVALFASLYYTRKMQEPLGDEARWYNLLTFGEMRPGNHLFSRFAVKKVNQHVNRWRVTHASDFMVRQPVHTLGYQHAGHEVFYVNGSRYKECFDFDGNEDHSCSRSTKGMSYFDHLVYLYTAMGCEPQKTLAPNS